ncbi:MAG TPA: hypothetical protein DDW90_10970 [Cyanobacteria bacterium UBA9971]|nr:hypothetical protein [Cyanobacteria bacterium UBA9971]
MRTAVKIEIKNPKFIIFLLAFLGLWVSIELCIIYFNANFVPNSESSFCSINNVIDCDAVAKTAFSSFLGIPWAIYGIGFYLFVLFLSLFPFEKIAFFKNFKNPQSYVFTLSSLAVINSAGLWVVSSMIIHKICLLCYILYGVNLFLLVFSKLGKPVLNHYKDSFKDLINIISDKRWLLIVIFVGLLSLTTLITINITKVFEPPANNNIQQQNMFSDGENTYQPHGNTLGTKNAKLVIHEYTDFQCPYCSISNSMMYRLVNEIEGIRVEHHDFPLNKQCNSLVQGSPHKDSCKAIYYARAAKMQGKYWDYITLLFDNQENLPETKLIELAKSINLDIDQLKKDAYSPEVKAGLEADIERARNFNITATPTYIIGIKKYEGIMPYPELKDTVLRNL